MAADLGDPVRLALDSVLDAVRDRRDRAVASYIPELAKVEPEFTIQSVSKPFVFALAVDALGLARVTEYVGLEPSGEPLNAISLDGASGRPLNPMINAGAIVTTSLMPGDTAAEKLAVVRAGLDRGCSAGERVALAEVGGTR